MPLSIRVTFKEIKRVVLVTNISVTHMVVNLRMIYIVMQGHAVGENVVS